MGSFLFIYLFIFIYYYYSETVALIHSQEHPVHLSSFDVLFLCFPMNSFVICFKILCFLCFEHSSSGVFFFFFFNILFIIFYF